MLDAYPLSEDPYYTLPFIVGNCDALEKLPEEIAKEFCDICALTARIIPILAILFLAEYLDDAVWQAKWIA